jgi:tripartite-type tricarboxylate transporter receptor subunit TctC
MNRSLALNSEKPRHDRRGRGCVLVAGGEVVIEVQASAVSCPDGPMQLVDPLSVGSGSDFLAPIFTEALTSALHQPMLVANKAGASGTIAARAVAHAIAGRHTLGVVGIGCLANPLL